MNIEVMLSLNYQRLTAIETRCGGVPDDCLREMLIEWLHQINRQPTKSALIEAVEVYNPSLTEEISALSDTKEHPGTCRYNTIFIVRIIGETTIDFQPYSSTVTCTNREQGWPAFRLILYGAVLKQ